MKKKLAVIVLLLVIIGTCIYFLTRKKENPNELTLYGNIEIRQVDMSFQVGGQLLKMLKEEGDSVKKDELIAVLEDKDYKANLEKASADVNKTLALKNDAESKYNRNLPLCTDNTVSQQECDNLLNTRDKTRADYEAALAAKNFAKNQLDYTKIYAPDEGTVTVRVQEPGATVNKGQIVYTISKTKPVWIRAYVNETDLGNIKYGQKATVFTDSVDPKTGKHREYQGYIGYISPVAEFTPKTVQSTDLRTSLVYRIRVYVDDIDEYLRQGMPTTIKINLTGNNSDEHGRN
ncbi:efflux RND transporter periplasmic adaptor subunit [bacterium]|uniref:Efflux RND transporter periplasmic adaptor subunit n=1 Tax=Candidatus Scatenecus faecavium TaxID=2840915 RepID=A0A9D1K4L0_9BACT|nr:efflux RND transporter periplasmic adaptor subunit [bacterium]HIS83661.1 efflux RND transporter periplasmic adaptor subunit [Candidatus Scatenecus faecavium]